MTDNDRGKWLALAWGAALVAMLIIRRKRRAKANLQIVVTEVELDEMIEQSFPASDAPAY